jgi:phage replication-related protein YjqB (UPF0714/DUF867 family)
MDKHFSFEELISIYREGVDFRERVAIRHSPLSVIAPHGGGIEPGTSELALAIAGKDLPFYLFEGIKKTGNKKLHIASTRFDAPDCLDLLELSQTALAVHGCVGGKPVIYLGGRDFDLRARLLEVLSGNGFSARIGKGSLAGIWKNNICNRTASGKGVQLEISTGLRKRLFEKLETRQGRKVVSGQFVELVSLIREVIVDFGW